MFMYICNSSTKMVVIHQILVTSKENNALNNHWADWSQISYGDSLSWGKEISYKCSWSHDHEGCYGPNGKNYKKKSSILEPKGQWSWYLVFSIGEMGPT